MMFNLKRFSLVSFPSSLLLSLLSMPVCAVDLILSQQIELGMSKESGHLVKSPEEVDWVDDNSLVFSTDRELISCYDLKLGRLWSVKVPEIHDWHYCRELRKLAVICGNRQGLTLNQVVVIIDVRTGKRVLSMDSADFARISHADAFVPARVGIRPTNGALILFGYSRSYGQNGILLDATNSIVEKRFDTDPFLSKVLVSRGDKLTIAYSSKDALISVRELLSNDELAIFGSRKDSEPLGRPIAIRNLCFDDVSSVLYTASNSWGTVNVCKASGNMRDNWPVHSNTENVALDANFKRGEFAIVVESGKVSLMNMNGDVIGVYNHGFVIADPRIAFSPNGKKLAVLSSGRLISIVDISHAVLSKNSDGPSVPEKGPIKGDGGSFESEGLE